MPGPLDPLTQILAQRASGQALPEALSPDQQATQAQAPLAGLRKPFEGGMDALLAVLGVRAQRPGVNMTGVGAMLGAGAPLVSKGLSPLLQEIFSKNPAAEEVYNRAMATQLPEALIARQKAGVSRYARQADAHDALLDLAYADRPRPIPTDTGFMTAIPLEGPSAKGHNSTTVAPHLGLLVNGEEAPSDIRPLIIGGRSNNQANTQATKLAKSGLTKDMIRDIRSLGQDMAIHQYPNLTYDTIRSIIRRDTWPGVK